MGRLSLFPEQASTMAGRVDALLFFLLAVTVFFVCLIAGLILYFMVRYRRRSDDERPPEVHGSMALEGLWTAIPFGLVMIMFFWGASIFAALRRPPDNALEIDVIGRQWMWKMQHMEGRREINELHVPLGRPVKITMTSEDVIHSFYVPAFRVKQDAVPGRYSTLWFEATKPGSYHLFCAEYCGTIHAGMIGRVVVMEPAAFQQWLASGSAGPGVVSVAAAGENIFTLQGCPSCHQAGPGQRGPALSGLYGSRVEFADGRTVVADETYLRESILNPQAKLVLGYAPIMPTYQGLLDEDDLRQVIVYLKALAAPAGAATGK